MADSIRKMMVNRTIGSFMVLLLNEVSVSESLKELGIDNICIYGMGILGQYFYRSLEDSDINIIACVDNKQTKHPRVEVITADRLDEMYGEINYYIITSEFYYEQIRDELVEKYSANTILLSDLINEIIFMNHCYL